MSTIGAKNALTAMWPIIYTARERPLSNDEIAELRRVCNVLEHCFPGREAEHDIIEQLCLSIHSSGVFETGNPKKADRLLEYIDDLRSMLE